MRPTANLLGWGRAVRLTAEQRQTIENCGIGEDGFAAENPRFCINLGLFEYIAGQMRRSTATYKAGAALHEHISGSLAQCAYIEKGVEEIGFSRARRYVKANIRGACAYQLEHRMSVVARIIAY